MTSINAIRFNETSGAMVFDEMRSWGAADMIIPSAQKMKPVVENEITLHAGLVAGYGNTGTSSIGDELRFTIRKRITQRWREEIEKRGEKPERFLTIEQVAQLAYRVICEMKHKHTNELLFGKYGFDTDDFIQGHYLRNETKIEIKEKEIVNAAEVAITFKDQGASARPVFGNAGIVAGYEPQEGFRIFHLSMSEQMCVPVQEIFAANGSGRDQCEIVFGDFAACRSIPERRGDIDPVEGTIGALDAVLTASRRNIGVGGYINLILFDGKKKGLEKMKPLLDDRARLAAEIVKARNAAFISHTDAHELIEDLCFKEAGWDKVNQAFFQKTPQVKGLKRYLRGYGYKD